MPDLTVPDHAVPTLATIWSHAARPSRTQFKFVSRPLPTATSISTRRTSIPQRQVMPNKPMSLGSASCLGEVFGLLPRAHRYRLAPYARGRSHMQHEPPKSIVSRLGLFSHGCFSLIFSSSTCGIAALMLLCNISSTQPTALSHLSFLFLSCFLSSGLHGVVVVAFSLAHV